MSLIVVVKNLVWGSHAGRCQLLLAASFFAQAIQGYGQTAVSINPTAAGIVVTVPEMAPVTMEYPLKRLNIVAFRTEETGAMLEYATGTHLRIIVHADGAIDYAFTNLPAEVKAVDLWMNLDPDLGDGGCFRLNDEPTQAFPETAEKLFLVQKHNARRWAVHDKLEHNLIFSLPGHTYLQVEDRRAEVPSRIRMIMACPVLPGNPRITVRVGELPASTAPENGPPLSINQARHPIVVDGKFEDWAGLPIQKIPPSRRVEGKSAESSSAAFQLCYDEEQIYLRVSVKDPTPLQNANQPSGAWSGDAVELFLGGNPVGQDGDLLRGDVQIVFGVSASGVLPFSRDLLSMSDIRSTVTATEGGWTLEAAVPFKSLGWSPAANREFRFDLGVDDSSDGKNRRCQLMWNGTNRNALNRTDWGRAVLEK